MYATPDNRKLSWYLALSVIVLSIVLIIIFYLALKQQQVKYYEKKQAKEALQKERDRAETTLSSLGEGVITTDTLGRIQYVNPKASEILLGSNNKTSLIDILLTDVYPKQYRHEAEKIMEGLSRCLESSKIIQLNNIKTSNQAGDTVLLDCTLSPMHPTDGKISGVALVLEDVTYLEDMRLQIENMAKKDYLTDLFNRYEFEHQIKEAIVNAHRNKVQHAFCYLDLDQFKLVNDTAGHIAGDQLLRQLSSNVFKRSIPTNAILGRLGGDEFGLLLFDTNIKQSIKICEQIIQDVQRFLFAWQDKRFQVGVSIGLVIINEFSLSVEQCLISADTACYLAKEKGRNRVESAHEDNHDMRQRQEELSWAERIPRAIEENRLVLFIQYMLPLKGVHPHAEILIRMRDEHGKLLSPNQFIPAAERYGVMSKVDRWIIQQSLKNITKLIQSKKNDGIIYSINLSGQSLTDENFPLFIHEELKNKPEIAKRVCFEITETATMANLSQALRCMKLIKDLGSSLALDDFGSGLSSFAYLRQMPVDYLKIDGAFVHNIHKDNINRAIVANMHQLAGVFNLKTVAEYVENEAILAELRKIGVDLAQGYGVHVPEEWIIQ
jgi:diguanylate cyclase (GGDEF)-like protein/PAS domain S-box-containing protein